MSNYCSFDLYIYILTYIWHSNKDISYKLQLDVFGVLYQFTDNYKELCETWQNKVAKKRVLYNISFMITFLTSLIHHVSMLKLCTFSFSLSGIAYWPRMYAKSWDLDRTAGHVFDDFVLFQLMRNQSLIILLVLRLLFEACNLTFAWLYFHFFGRFVDFFCSH